MQQLAAGAAVLLAQVEVEDTFLGGRLQAQALLQPFEVALQGDGGRLGGDFAQLLADLQLLPDQVQLLRLAPAQRRQGGLAQLVEARGREVANRRERVRHPDGLDDVGRRGVEVLGTQQTGDVGEPAAADVAARRVPEVLVVAG